MATDTLQPETAPATGLALRDLYIAYCSATAAFTAYNRFTSDETYSEEEACRRCRDHAASINAFLKAPANTISELALKLEVFRDEEIEDNWRDAKAIVAQLDRCP